MQISLAARFKTAVRSAARAAGAALARPVPFAGRGLSSFFDWLPGSQYDYEREAGSLWKNSIVLACLKWIETNFPEAPLVVFMKGAGAGAQSLEAVEGHPLAALIRRPNPFYGPDLLWAGTLLDLAFGDAYWLKVRCATGEVVQLWWIPRGLIAPAWPEDGSVFISHYVYSVNGQKRTLPVSEVVHFRDGVDPDNDRQGLGRLGSVLREVCTDNEAATLSAALSRNMGVPGVVISPESLPGAAGGGASSVSLKPDARQEMEERWASKFTGDGRGRPFISALPLKVQPLGFSPADLAMDVMRRVPEERVSAVLGVPAIVAGLGAGLARSTFANYKEAREAAYENGIVPRQRLISVQLDVQLLPDFEPFVEGGVKGHWVGFDLSNVRALQDDQDALFKRLTVAYQGGWILRSEARRKAGYAATADDDIYCPSPKPVTEALQADSANA